MKSDFVRINGSELTSMVIESIRRTMLLESMSPEEVRGKYYPDVPVDVFNSAVNADPTSTRDKVGRYVKWILNLYKNGPWKPGDSYETKDALSKFHRLRQNLELKDINAYKSVRQLLDAVSEKKSKADVKHSGADKVYEDNEWVIIVPKTEEASKLYGKDTKWCTAADNDNYFDYYNRRGPLYINIRKRDGQKWQFHFESRSFMDAEDDPIYPSEIGLSMGALDYYASIGKSKVFLPFNELASMCASEVRNGTDPREVFDSCYEADGLFCVGLRKKLNFIRPDGTYLSDTWFDYAWPFSEGFARVKLNGKGWNFIRPDGTYLSDTWFDKVQNFYGGLAMVALDGHWYKLSKYGELYNRDGSKANVMESRIRTVLFNNIKPNNMKHIDNRLLAETIEKCIQRRLNEYAVKQRVKQIVRESIRSMAIDEEETEGSEKESEKKRRRQIESYFQQKGVNPAQFAYKLFGVTPVEGEDTNKMKNARSLFMKKVYNRENDEGSTYQFTPDETTKLRSMISSNDLD